MVLSLAIIELQNTLSKHCLVNIGLGFQSPNSTHAPTQKFTEYSLS